MTDYTEFSNEETQVTEEQPKQGIIKKYGKYILGGALVACTGACTYALGYKNGKNWFYKGEAHLKLSYSPNKVHFRLFSDEKFVNGMVFDPGIARDISKELLELADKAEKGE